MEKLQIYEKYDGDIDGWAQIGTSKEKQVMSDADWFLIQDIIQDILLIEKNATANIYREKIEKKLRLAGVEDILFRELLKLAKINL